MATTIDSLSREKQGRLFERALAFQRGGRADSLRKGRRRRTLRVKHIVMLSVLTALAFFAVSRVYLFLISWDHLTVRKVQVGCTRTELKESLGRYFAARPLGNMLLCDVDLIQKQLKTLAWVKDVRVQKIFPETLKVEVVERMPYAIVEYNGTFVVDENGVMLQAAGPGEDWGLPLVQDENGFRDHFLEKWQAARACIADLTTAQTVRLASVECSNDGRLTLRFKEDAVVLIVDGTSIRGKLEFFDANRALWERQFGALASVDLRLDDRAIILPLEQTARNLSPTPVKEAL